MFETLLPPHTVYPFLLSSALKKVADFIYKMIIFDYRKIMNLVNGLYQTILNHTCLYRNLDWNRLLTIQINLCNGKNQHMYQLSIDDRMTTTIVRAFVESLQHNCTMMHLSTIDMRGYPLGNQLSIVSILTCQSVPVCLILLCTVFYRTKRQNDVDCWVLYRKQWIQVHVYQSCAIEMHNHFVINLYHQQLITILYRLIYVIILSSIVRSMVTIQLIMTIIYFRQVNQY